MPEKKYPILLSLLFIGLISVPGIQTLTRLLPERSLTGYYYEQKFPALHFDSLITGTYQSGLNRFLEQHYGFRNFYTRLYNQIDYSLFRQPHGSGVVTGKDGYLFEEWFISAYHGNNYIGDEQIKLKLRWLQQVSKYFRNQGKELIVVVAPGKADFFPEYIPNRMLDSLKRTNYSVITEALALTDIPLLDFNRLFIRFKEVRGCPLFPKTGTHWSHFGSRIATDTLAGFLQTILGRSLPDIRLGPAIPTDKVMSPDDDLEQLLNLLFPLRNDQLCYPEIHTEDATGYKLPSAIVIGDSFFWEIYNLGLTGKLFEKIQFWYYNQSVYPESGTGSLNTVQLQFPVAFKDAELIILMANPSNIHEIGWGFIERVFKELVHEDWQREYDKMVLDYIQAIRNTPAWEKQIEEKAKEKGIPKDSQMLLDARYMVEQYLLKQDLL